MAERAPYTDSQGEQWKDEAATIPWRPHEEQAHHKVAIDHLQASKHLDDALDPSAIRLVGEIKKAWHERGDEDYDPVRHLAPHGSVIDWNRDVWNDDRYYEHEFPKARFKYGHLVPHVISGVVPTRQHHMAALEGLSEFHAAALKRPNFVKKDQEDHEQLSDHYDTNYRYMHGSELNRRYEQGLPSTAVGPGPQHHRDLANHFRKRAQEEGAEPTHVNQFNAMAQVHDNFADHLDRLKTGSGSIKEHDISEKKFKQANIHAYRDNVTLPTPEHRSAYRSATHSVHYAPGSIQRQDAAVGLHAMGLTHMFPKIASEIKPKQPEVQKAIAIYRMMVKAMRKPSEMLQEMINKAVKKTQHLEPGEKGARKLLRQQQRRTESGWRKNPVQKAIDEAIMASVAKAMGRLGHDPPHEAHSQYAAYHYHLWQEGGKDAEKHKDAFERHQVAEDAHRHGFPTAAVASSHAMRGTATIGRAKDPYPGMFESGKASAATDIAKYGAISNRGELHRAAAKAHRRAAGAHRVGGDPAEIQRVRHRYIMMGGMYGTVSGPLRRKPLESKEWDLQQRQSSVDFHTMRAIEHDHLALIADASKEANKKRNDLEGHQMVIQRVKDFQNLPHGNPDQKAKLNKLIDRHQGHVDRLTQGTAPKTPTSPASEMTSWKMQSAISKSEPSLHPGEGENPREFHLGAIKHHSSALRAAKTPTEREYHESRIMHHTDRAMSAPLFSGPSTSWVKLSLEKAFADAPSLHPPTGVSYEQHHMAAAKYYGDKEHEHRHNPEMVSKLRHMGSWHMEQLMGKAITIQDPMPVAPQHGAVTLGERKNWTNYHRNMHEWHRKQLVSLGEEARRAGGADMGYRAAQDATMAAMDAHHRQAWWNQTDLKGHDPHTPIKATHLAQRAVKRAQAAQVPFQVRVKEPPKGKQPLEWTTEESPWRKFKELPKEHQYAIRVAHAAMEHPPGSEQRRDAAVGLHATGMVHAYPEIAAEIKPETEEAKKSILVWKWMAKAQPGEEPGEFRGGDPEELQQKKEEKRKELEETGGLDKAQQKLWKEQIPGGAAAGKKPEDFDSEQLKVGTKHELEHTKNRKLAQEITMDHLEDDPNYYRWHAKHDPTSSEGEGTKKAQPGEEAGAFRGGDPEELQFKKEEKRREREESDEIEEEEGEEVDEFEIEEAIEAQKQRDEDHGKSMEKSIINQAIDILKAAPTGPATEVSPVDTYEDYRPRDYNGDPLDVKYSYLGRDPVSYRAPGPIRPGPNQHRNWSEVIGMKIPLTGEPIQHLRRFWKIGQYGQMVREREKLIRSMPFYVPLPQDGILWEPTIYKAIGDPGKAFHKYVSRKWNPTEGRWDYSYADEMHTRFHGMGHTGNINGHTIEAHPDFKQTAENAEEAYHHARHTALHEGGAHRIGPMMHKFRGTDKPEAEYETTMVLPGARKDPKTGKTALPAKAVELHINTPEGLRVARVKDLEAFDRRARRDTIHRERDEEGKPWLEWRETGGGTGKPRVRHNPESRFALADPKYHDWHQRTSSTAALKRQIEEHKEHQRGVLEEEERASVPPEERMAAYDFPPELHPETGEELYPVTNKLERGELGHWTDKDVSFKTEKGKLIQKRVRVHTWIDPKDPSKTLDKRHKIIEQIRQEHLPHFQSAVKDFMRNQMKFDDTAEKQIRAAEHKGKMSPDLEGRSGVYQQVRDFLMGGAVGSTINDTVNKYDPRKGVRYRTFMMNSFNKWLRHHFADAMRHAGLKAYSDSPHVQRHFEAIPREGPPGKREKPKETPYVSPISGEVVRPGEAPITEAPPTKYGEIQAAGGVRGRREQQRRPEMTEGRLHLSTPEEVFAARSELGSQQEPYDNPTKPWKETPPPERKETPEERHQKMFEEWGNIRTPPTAPAPGKMVGGAWVMPEEEEKTKKALLFAADLLKAAEEEKEEPSGMRYRWREGEPGATKHMWETPSGNVVQGTNAPEGHPHHEPEKGPPMLHPSEPTPQTAPEFFDQFGRKLDRPIPPNVNAEQNYHYDPHVNSWSHKYEDPETGQDEHIYLHSDKANDERHCFNMDARHVDAQLEKLRGGYKQLVQSQQPHDRALGLMMALVDQGKMIADGPESGITSLKVKDVKPGSVTQFNFKDAKGEKHSTYVVLDGILAAVLQELMQGKKPGDYLFQIDDQRIAQHMLVQAMNNSFGISPRQLRVYHGTALFSKEFQRLAATQKDLTPEHLPDLADQAFATVAQAMGHKGGDHKKLAQELYVDPIVIESLYMAAVHHHNPEVNKGLITFQDLREFTKGYKLAGKTVFQGLPISIENAKGSSRKWYDPHEKREGTTKMKHAYGYIRRTKGTDGDHVDVYIGPDKNAKTAFVVHQMKGPEFKKFDEDKCMLGFGSAQAAKRAYMQQYDKPGFFGGMTAIPMEKFKEKVFATAKRPGMIKSDIIVKGRAAPLAVWHVSVDHPERSSEEQLFGHWLHSHPIHEHDEHWHSFRQATGVEQPLTPPSNREYAEDAEPLEEAKEEVSWGEHEPEPETPPQEAAGAPEEGAELNPTPPWFPPTPPPTAKSMVSQMLAELMP